MIDGFRFHSYGGRSKRKHIPYLCRCYKTLGLDFSHKHKWNIFKILIFVSLQVQGKMLIEC